MTHDIVDFVRVSSELLEAEESFASITLLDIRGSAPQIIGAKAIVTDQGLVAGTIGGGKIEAEAIKYCQKCLREDDGKLTDLVTWNLQTDIGMTCGGEVQLFFEYHRKSIWPIAVFGAGHVAQALIPLLTRLNCRITCIDPRSDWLARLPEHPKLQKRCVDQPVDEVDRLPPHTFFVLMSKGHSTDLPVLARILETRDAPYVGVIGSLQKASVLKRDLKKMGISEEKLDSFNCPIGLPLGNNTPMEISISIVAQLIQVRDEKGVFSHRKKTFPLREN